MAEQTKITAYDNGPYLVSGPVSITDSDGNEYQKEQETVALCRCGASTNKPFWRRYAQQSRLRGRRAGGAARRLE